MALDARNKTRRYWLLMLGMMALVLVTRLLTVRHSMGMHPDEWIFYYSASSVVTPPDYAFKAIKFYPNGAFVFQMPFQFVAQILSQSGMAEISQRLAGRLASIVYYTCGCALGLRLVWRLSGKRLSAAVFYALIMVFSLFQLEQSRYGTGDPVSLLLLMGILTLLDTYVREQADFYLYASAFCVGVLTAIKFPLIVFLVLPIGQRCLMPTKKARTKDVCLCVLFSVVGLLVFTPQFFSDPTFFMKAFFSEFDAYVGAGAHTPWDHFLSVNLLQFLYADVLLGPVFAVIGLRALQKRQGEERSLYRWVLPMLLWAFFLVNVFVKKLQLRTYYPFFCLQAPYIALGLSACQERSRIQKILALACASFLVVRGGMFIGLFATTPSYEQVLPILASDAGWSDRVDTVTVGGSHLSRTSLKAVPEKRYAHEYDEADRNAPRFPLFPGEYAITTVPGMVVNQSGGADGIEFLGQTGSYFDRYFYGSWLVGSTLESFEMPMYFLYYYPDDRETPPLTTEKRDAYTQLYLTWEPAAYFEQLAMLEDTTIAVVSRGAPGEALLQVLPFVLEGAAPGQALAMTAEWTDTGYDETVASGGATATHQTALGGDEAESLSLLGENQGDSSIAYRGREYAHQRPGLSVAVYDAEAKAMLDWVYLYEDNGTVLLERY